MSAPDTGNSATVTFGTSAFAVDVTRIGALSIDLPVLNSSHLGTTVNESYVMGDLCSLDPIECDYWWDPQFGTATKEAPIGTIKGAAQSAETISFTWPVQSGDSTGLILTGSGFVNHVTAPELLNNALQSASYSVQFAGGSSGPTWTNPSV
jgi:hypothetical protein